MEVAKLAKKPVLEPTMSPVGWTRKALNYRIPRRGANYTLFSISADTLSTLLALFTLVSIIDYVLPGLSASGQFSSFGNLPLWAFVGCVLVSRILTFNFAGIYATGEQPRFITEVTQVTTAVLASMLALLGVFYMTQTVVTMPWILTMTIVSLGLHVGWRGAVYFWSYYSTVRRILAPQRVLIIGATEVGREIAEIINRFPLPTTRVVGFLDNNLTGLLNDIPIIGNLDDNIFKIIREHDIDEVILTTTRNVARDNSSAIVNLQYVPVNVRLVPNYLKFNLYSVSADSLDQLPLLHLRNPAIHSTGRVLKRAMDILAASTGLILVLPVFSLIAFLIWLNDKGPIFFKQERYGENGKIFQMLKFRSMVVDAEKLVDSIKITDENDNTIYKRKDDPRVTTIGKIIRKTSLDELPQLINIIRGDMSIVGPRPEVRRIVEDEYKPWQYQRMRVPQGLTGWWQVTSRGTKECYTDTEKDIFYIDNYSIWFDIKIILMTIPALIKAKGAF